MVTGLGGYASPDNFLYPAGPFLDAAGFSVDTATPNLFNFYYDGNYAEISPVISAPVPEPATWARMLAGFAGLGYAGYRKSRKAAPIAA